MLPDFSETKRMFARFFHTYMRRNARALSPLGAAKTRYLHEGRGMKVVRADQSESDTQVQQLTSQFEIRFDEIESLTFEKALRKHDEVIIDMVRKQAGLALNQLDNEIPESQKVDARGRPLDAKMIIEMYEAIELEFYPDGSPHELHLVGGLFTPEKLQSIDEEFENNPELQKQFDELMERKRDNWRAREASRKLVG